MWKQIDRWLARRRMNAYARAHDWKRALAEANRIGDRVTFLGLIDAMRADGWQVVNPGEQDTVYLRRKRTWLNSREEEQS
jgi:hypothetical protein